MVSGAVQYWPNVLRESLWIATSWWFPLVLSALCLVLWCILTKKVPKYSAQFGHAPQPAPSVQATIPSHDLSYLADPAYDHFWQPAESRIRVSCGKEVEGCVSKDHRGIWYRARLDITGPNVSGVEASIIGIWENDVKVNLYGENVDVSMCEKEGKGQTVLMREGRPEYINLLFAAYDAGLPPVLSLKHYPAPLGERAYFKLNHEYKMSVVITCDNTHPSVPFRVKMKLKSNDELEEFQLI
jgi:hypothetical protein